MSEEKVCHQAICVWTGERPAHLMKTLDNLGEEYIQSLASSQTTNMTSTLSSPPG